jgi:hypothetical protein
MDSLTDEQRKGVAEIINDADIESDYTGMDSGGGSFAQEDARATLSALSHYFRTYDPASVVD